MYKSVLSKLATGEKLQTIVRIKPTDRPQVEDIKVLGQAISLFDTNNRLIENFEYEDVYGPTEPIQKIFDNSLSQYLTAFIQGFSLSIFGFGGSESGKTQTIEGNVREPGLILMFADSLFNVMENKKYSSTAQGQVEKFSYNIRIRYVELLDEEVKDLIPSGQPNEGVAVINNEWEGPTVLGAQWISVANAAELKDVLIKCQKNRTNTANEFGKLSNKATSFFTIELIQNTELANRKESVFMVSRMNFIDLPGCEALMTDAETLKVREGSTLNKGIICVSNLIRDLAANRGEYVFYDGSILTQLCRDILGGNSLTVGIFNIAYNDYKNTSITLTYMNYAKNIMNFPVINDGKAIGLFKKYRSEIIQLLNSGGAGGPNSEDYNMRIADLEKRLIEDNLDKLKGTDEKHKLGSKLNELREKYNQLVKSKAEIQGELIKSEEEKLEISKALVELQIENTRLLEVLQNEKYDANNRLLNAENDLVSAGMKEETAIKTVSDLQDRIKELSELKREVEIELVALRKNYLTIKNDYDNEKLKNEHLGLEVINLVNENKSLQNELGDTFKRASMGTDENERYLNRLSKLERENQEKAQSLIEAKAEIERLKTEFVKYEMLEQRHKLDLDTKRLEVERGFYEISKDNQEGQKKYNQELDQNKRKGQDDRLLWESEKIELSHKNKLLARQINEVEERFRELSRQNEELSAENTKMTIQIDEMRSVYRQKLLQFMGDQVKGDKGGGRIGYDLNAREELIRTYTEKEIDLKEKTDNSKQTLKSLRMENRALKNYARSLKYLAEDWAPVGVALPDILIKPPPTKLEDESLPQGYRSQEDEIERLRARNRSLEEQVRMAQGQLASQSDLFAQGRGGDDRMMQNKIYNELQMLKSDAGQQRMASRGQNSELLRKERNDLQEENRRLINLLKDNKKWDIYVLQKENEKLMRSLKEYESNESVAPTSGDAVNLKQKVLYYEKTMKQFEKERSELIVRATMAEEQLKSLQEHLRKTTQEYSKKIHELKKKVGEKGF